MLSQKALNALKLLRTTPSSFQPISTSCITFHYPLDMEPSEENKPERKLKEWRESLTAKEPIIPLDCDNSYFKMFRTKVELTPWGLKKHFEQYARQQEIDVQRFSLERHKILGPDLSAAHFSTFLGGKVMFKGNDQWISYDKDGKNVDLPNKFDPNYVLIGVDVSDCGIFYEGFENFNNCPRVKWASFARCAEVDDWCLDSIASNFPLIEHLDLSDCPKLSERGLEALFKTSMLKTLIVTNNYKSAAFELTCMMLEDVIPGLQIEIREPKEKAKPQINKLD